MSTLSSTDTYLCFACERTACIERSPFVTKCKVRIPPAAEFAVKPSDDEIETANDELDEAHERFMNIGDAEAERKIETAENSDNTQSCDAVHSPSHYTKGGIECISAIKASMTADGFCDYCKGNVLKYLWRWRDKGGVQDLEKAKVYLDWLIEAAKGDIK